MILYTISLQLVKGHSPPPIKIVQLFLELTLGAIVLGVAFGYISAQLINRVRNNPILTLNITVVSCYLLYFTAEYVDLGIKISGIMALVAMGLYMAAFGKTKIAPESHEVVENFWKIFIFIAETIIFILGGVIVGVQSLKPEFMEMLDGGNLQRVFLLYLCMTMARFLSITVFMPKLQSEGYGLRWK
jgi:NhaP-type Na+/H+ or K+/H+ antiporter